MKNDFQIDQTLNIRTTGIREWKENQHHYHRCESTPYRGLDRLFQVYQMPRNPHFVDFGCGRGRVPIYVYHHFKIPVRGIELHDLTFDELLANKERYQVKYSENFNEDIYLEYGHAENYEIQKEDNVFYFFNPFSIVIFDQVMTNIEESIKKHPRDADVILYYPTNPYLDRMQKSIFQKINEVRLPWKNDRHKRFNIYRYRKQR